MPAEQNSDSQVSTDYFAKRELRHYVGVASLWALGVGAVISGHYPGWNLGLLSGGWGGVWFTLGIIWFALIGQNRLVLAPEEAFAVASEGPSPASPSN
jgi:ethanolamine permease